MLIFYLEFIYTSCITYFLYLFFRSLARSTSFAWRLVDYSLRCARGPLRPPSMFTFPTTLGTCRLVSTLCSKTVLTTEHVYVLNHARGLVHQSLRRARGLCQPPTTFTFPTMLGDWSTSLYAVLGDCADHRARLHSQPCSETHQSLSALCSGLASITLRPQLEYCFF